MIPTFLLWPPARSSGPASLVFCIFYRLSRHHLVKNFPPRSFGRPTILCCNTASQHTLSPPSRPPPPFTEQSHLSRGAAVVVGRDAPVLGWGTFVGAMLLAFLLHQRPFVMVVLWVCVACCLLSSTCAGAHPLFLSSLFWPRIS